MVGAGIPVWKAQSERITRKRRLVLDEDVRAALCPAPSRELENKERERRRKYAVCTYTERERERPGTATTNVG